MSQKRMTLILALPTVCLGIYWIVANENQPSVTAHGRAFSSVINQIGQTVGVASSAPPGSDHFTRTLWAADEAEEASGPVQGVGEILLALDDLAGQGLDHEELLNSEHYQLLMAKLQSDPAARRAVLQRIMTSSGTPLGKTLTLALATSGGGVGMRDLKGAAEWLLKNGDSEQRAEALQLLGATPSYTPQARAVLLEALKRDGGNPEVAVAAMANLVRQGGASESERQAIIKDVTPFVASDDARVRLNGYQVLAKWGAHDPDALQTLTDVTSDPDPNVRRWVISAFGNGEFAYENVRATLLETLQNPDEEPEIKAVAQGTLTRFTLDEPAQAAVQQQWVSEGYRPPPSGFGFN